MAYRKWTPGTRWHRLVILERLPGRKFLCKCDCGNEKTVYAANMGRILLSGFAHTGSCGCLQREEVSKRSSTHRSSNSRAYSIWGSMKKRCGNVCATNYKNYGGRGIAVCERWLHSFENFKEDMGEPPEGLTLDRKDNNGDYNPGNCRWATWSEQNKNRRPWGKRAAAA